MLKRSTYTSTQQPARRWVERAVPCALRRTVVMVHVAILLTPEGKVP